MKKSERIGNRLASLAGLGLAAILWHTGASAAVGWNVDPPMATVRAQHGAALLDDGSAIVINGVSRTGFITSAERYNAGAWSSIGTVGIQGNVTTGVALATGQVLVQTDGSTSSRLYDPLTNTWQAAGTMSAARIQPSLVLLADGRVLAAGGLAATAELYNPVTRTWSPTGSMGVARRAHGTTLLRDGRVLVASGFGGGGTVPSAELYDPASGTWSPAAPPLVPRYYATMSLLPDGRALLTGGFTAGGVTTHAELYDPATNTWTATGAMVRPRNGHVATTLASGQVLVAGGADGARNTQTDTEIYDAATGLWTSAGSTPFGRENSTITLLPNGDALVTGGYSSNPSLTFYAAADRYTPLVGAGPAPVIDALPLLQRSGVALALTGTGFKGGGGAAIPRLELQRVGNGAFYTFAPAAHTAASFTSPALGVLPSGLYMARVVADNVPSVARLVHFIDPPGIPAGTPSNGQATVTWSAPAYDGGNPPLSYTLTSSPAGAGCTTTAPVTSCNIAGLTNGTSYTFTVQAQHANGPGPTSLVSAAVVPVLTQFTGITGGGTVTAVLTGGGPACTLVAGDTFLGAPPAGAPANLTFPYGVFNFRATGCVPGSTVQVAVTYPAALPAQVQYWKYGPATPAAADTWFSFAGAALQPDGRTVVYSIVDNGIGDRDPAAGTVLDPIGVVIPIPAASLAAIPALSPAGIAMLTLTMLAVFGWSRRRTRH